MKASGSTLRQTLADYFLRWRDRIGAANGEANGSLDATLQWKAHRLGKPWATLAPDEEPPLRSALLSAEQMEQHGKALAASHRLTTGRAADQLLGRLAANEDALVGVCSVLTAAVSKNHRITPAGEWLLDNFYLIEEQIRSARRALPKNYSIELPQLAIGLSAGRPRAYDIAIEIISHGDGRVDCESIERFVVAYQTVTELKLGELWAIPIMLRLAVIENLRRVGVQVAAAWIERNLAAAWADRMIEIAEVDPKSLILVIAEMAHSNPPMVGAFVAELVRRLKGRGPALALPLTWIEQRLAESGLTIDQLVQTENQQQAADQVSISNSIGSLRVLGAIDWRDFVETMSVVELTLLGDPGGVYGRMDFATRDHYRHAAERIAKAGRLSEGEVARAAVDLARAGAAALAKAPPTAPSPNIPNGPTTPTTPTTPTDARVGHVGFYLIGKGLPALEQQAAVRLPTELAWRRRLSRFPLAIYLGAIALITTLVAISLLAPEPWDRIKEWGAAAPIVLTAITFLVLLAASQLAVAVVNWLATRLVMPHAMPRMDFSAGIPEEFRTLVVVPTMLGSAAGIEDLIEALEVRFLANQDERLHFALLTDFCDAPQESTPADAPLVQLARQRIDELNAKQRRNAGRPAEDRFFLFHRPRQWNAQEGRWMGRERKRGKLADLNRLLRLDDGARQASGKTCFSQIVGNTAILSGVRYVITIDTDTQLPRDAARQFVGAMAHPLNRPLYDPAIGRVIEGYGILQPRVSASLPGSNRSLYARLNGGDPGIDPYTRAVSNVYQDVFGEGSFIGKGIYDVDAFEQALQGRFPDNQILSHDLIEGCYARSGLLSDIELYEDSPSRYATDVSRRYRWIRGDWQLAGWLLRYVPYLCKNLAGVKTEQQQSNTLSVLSQWKLLDNLRRSLIPAALTLICLLGWTIAASPAKWTLAVLGIMLIPSLCPALVDLLRKPDEVLFRQHLAASGRSARRQLAQVLFDLACLPYEAFFTLSAIARTVWRMLVSRRHLLEWKTSSEVERDAAMRGEAKLASTYRTMWFAPAFALASANLLATYSPAALLVAGPILLLWASAPAIAWWISRPLATRTQALSVEQSKFLRQLARRTWAFFQKFVGADDHWLPPDNYQEYRVAAVAHRTSPTNIGLALLGNLSAYDFGYIPTGQLLTRTANTLRTMASLERYRGHFYNWYDTQTLIPLLPQYISTVDSGNLAGHLLTLRAGLLGLADQPVPSPRLFDGLQDVLGLVVDAADKMASATTGKVSPTIGRAIQDLDRRLSAAKSFPPAVNPATHETLTQLAAQISALESALADQEIALAAEIIAKVSGGVLLNGESADPNPLGSTTPPQRWARAMAEQCQEALDELNFIAPWLRLPSALERMTTADMSSAAGSGTCSLRHLAKKLVNSSAVADPNIDATIDSATTPAQRDWQIELQDAITTGATRASDRLAEIEQLARQAGELALMDFGFLFDPARHLFTIGYNVSERRTDAGYYDLLASEARLCNFVAIAQGQLPQESWFALGRLLTSTAGAPVLLSWSGSMFEYLMPMLVMPTYENTLLDQTCKAAVARQIEYGKQRGVPWGMSESGYNTVDVHLNYQYRAFGVPGLGLKRGLAEDLVVAPYASVMALMVAPVEACINLQRLSSEGHLGHFGFFEAIDYTPARQRRGETQTVVRSFMAHHQGMSLLALTYQLLDRPMQRRFEAERPFQSVMLLLQERIPKSTTLFSHSAKLAEARSAPAATEMPIRVFTSPNTPVPQVQLLSNGRYHVMVTNAGGGYSRWKDLAVTRWREDVTCDDRGSFCYIRELTSGANGRFWSAAHQPTRQRAESYEAIFSEGRAEFRRRDAVGVGEGSFESHTEIVVSPEDDIELRRVRITNRSRQRREIDVTSYAEVVIALSAADMLHPAFSNLFVQTEIMPARRAILCTRRPRSQHEAAPWMFHLMTANGTPIGEISYETDRARFVGRTRDTSSPQAMMDLGALSGSAGSVLDPIVAIRYRLMLEPEQSITIDIVSGVAESRETALGLIDKYQDRHFADRVFDLAWTHSQVVLRQLNASEADSQLYARLASSVIFPNASLRADSGVLLQNRRGQSGLWGYAISGDLPIVLLQIGDAANFELVRQLVQTHAYWRLKGLEVDLVIWNEDHAGYRQKLQEQIMGLISSGIEASVIDRPGGIFVRSAEHISAEDRILFQSYARAIITDSRLTLLEQLDHRAFVEPRPPMLVPTRQHRPEFAPSFAALPDDLMLANGRGGFSANGREYVIALAEGQVTPAPWVNVLANPHFGTVISESGSAYTWSENAHEFRLTPWHNDPVSDTCGEAFYLRDEESGHFWSPTPLPAPGAMPYLIRHGFGYSVFQTQSAGIHSELWVYVATDAAIKLSVLKVRNQSGRTRQLSATAYVEWVIGDLRSKTAMHVTTGIDRASGALYARNPLNTEFADRYGFLDTDEPKRSFTGDRSEFIGRNGSLRNPAAMRRLRLSGKVGAGLDPCGAIQVGFELADGQEQEVVFRLGAGRNADDAGKLAQRFRGPLAAHSALEAVRQHWQRSLGTIQVNTPDPALNVMTNGWLVYQTLACRLWARSGYYQSGGAFGYRDQLQDVMALVHAEPGLVREHLLRCAGHQFEEGDVQHWWHPPSGRGVRTRCSDDYLWLALAVCRYVSCSGDQSVLDEPVQFLQGRPVNPEDDSYYDLPGRSGETSSLYVHCTRAIEHGLRFGIHGLPLIGSGDWNDGMNRVGIGGRGESVWLAFFLCEVLGKFSALAENYGDPAFAERCRGQKSQLRKNIESHAWDGAWYRRAWFDDGTPLGSAANEECRIDSISQSWSVLSAADEEEQAEENRDRRQDLRPRSRQAMQAVYDRLVRREVGLIQLLDPPFDKSLLDPGYIRGYVPGVRENGGQYTHGAVWAAMAFAALGDHERAWELLNMILPVNRANPGSGLATYKVEPYVMAADVYALSPHTGRGGWTWYTGAAGWTYRLIVESLLGLHREGDQLHLAPCLPAEWPGFTLSYRYRRAHYHIVVVKTAGLAGDGTSATQVSVDGVAQANTAIQMVDEDRAHQVLISIPA